MVRFARRPLQQMSRVIATKREDASAHSLVVTGRVARVRSRRDGGWRVRLTETGGALAAAEIHPSTRLPLPRRGARILIRGPIGYDAVHDWYTVDPVEGWHEAHEK